MSICTNHTAGNTLNLQQERDIQIFSTQSGSQATCKLLDTCKHYLYKPDTCKPLTTTTLLTSDLVSCSGDEGGDDSHEYAYGQASQGHREKGEEGQQDLEGGDV